MKDKKNKTGGRVAGTPNRTTAEIREQFQKLVDNNLEQLTADLKELEPKDRVKIMIDLAKFILPTLKAVELNAGEFESGINPILITFDFET